MLTRILTCAKIALCLAATTLLVVLAVFALDLRRSVAADQVALAETVKKINLDLDESHRLILEAGLTAREARKASAEERSYLGKWNAEIVQTLTSANGLLVSLRATSDGIASSQQQIAAETVSTLRTANTTIAGLGPVEANAGDEIKALQTATASLTRLASDPNIPATVAGLRATSDQAAQAMTHVNGVTADVQQAVHSYLHPSLLQKIYSAIANTGIEVAKFFW